jgi:serine/threonine protein kinase
MMDNPRPRKGKLPSKLVIPDSPKVAPIKPPVEEEFKRQQSVRVRSADELQFIQVIGQGSSAVVEKCVHLPTGTFVARKRVTLASDPELQKQAVREVEILNRCKSPNVIHSYVTFLRGTQMDIIMEYMDRGSLKDALEQSGRLSEPLIGHLAFQVLMGLDYLHKNRKIVHRDIKPSNLMLSSAGLVKISDFGISASMSHTNATKHTYVGTVTYMSVSLKQ